jgi:hypothetical protein
MDYRLITDLYRALPICFQASWNCLSIPTLWHSHSILRWKEMISSCLENFRNFERNYSKWKQCRPQYTSILQNLWPLINCEVHGKMLKRYLASEAVKAADSSHIKKHLAERRSCRGSPKFTPVWIHVVFSVTYVFRTDHVCHGRIGKYRIIFFRIAGRISVQTNSLNLDICEERASKGLLNRLGCPDFTNWCNLQRLHLTLQEPWKIEGVPISSEQCSKPSTSLSLISDHGWYCNNPQSIG